MGTEVREGREREGWGGEVGKVGHRKKRTHFLEGRKREEWVGELRNMACRKKRTHFLEGRKRRSKLVSSETWHAGNEDSLSGGEEEGGTGWSAQKCGTLQNRNSPSRREGAGEAGW